MKLEIVKKKMNKAYNLQYILYINAYPIQVRRVGSDFSQLHVLFFLLFPKHLPGEN